MPGKSRAMIFRGPGVPLELAEFALPRLGTGELLVEVSCSTLCGSDVHSFAGKRVVQTPTILGHEILGRVVELPPGEPPRDLTGRPVAIGDRVTWSIAASCGQCFYCQHGLPQKCVRLFKYGHEPVTDAHPLSGGLAEHCHLALGTPLLRVPDELPDVVACPANCAAATVAAALRHAGDVRGQVVLIQGAGMLGIVSCAMARHAGAQAVVICDVNRERLATAERFGATHAVPLTSEGDELSQTLKSLTEGRGADVALEMCGNPAAVESGVGLLRIGGVYVLVGAVFPSRPAALAPETIVRRMLNIRGVHNYAPQDLATALSFLAATHRTYPFEELVGQRFSLAETDAAFAAAKSGAALRVAVLPK